MSKAKVRSLMHCGSDMIYEGLDLRCVGGCKKLFRPPTIDLVEVDEITPYVDLAKMILEEFHDDFSAIPEHYRRRAWSRFAWQNATYDLIQRLYFSR